VPDPERRAMLVADLGNSAARLALWDGAHYAERRTVDAPESIDRQVDDWLRALRGAAARVPDRAAVASVVPERTGALVRALDRGGVAEMLVLDPAVHDIVAHYLKTPQTTGADRLAAARAAWEEVRGPVVIVDAGTAVTVDAVDPEGVFLGGAILPGPRAWLAALGRSAAALPSLAEVPVPSSAQGTSTHEALAAGLWWGLAGAVDRLIDAHRARVGANAAVLVTGGAGQAVGARMQRATRYVPDLVLDGVRSFALAYWRAHGDRPQADPADS